nr:protein FAR1-related sequence 5-like [Tanacetum cinerariifolium]
MAQYLGMTLYHMKMKGGDESLKIVAYEKESDETRAVKKLNALYTLESFVTHSNFDTPGGTVYYILKVFADVLLVKENVYDSVDDCIVAYMKYAAEAGFVVRRSCQKRLRNGDVKQKYLVCNRKGCPKVIHVDTLDLENSDKQKKNSNLHINGCKARVVFNLDPHTRKFVLNVFDTIHNHELEREEFKHLSKREMQLTYLEQAFIVKAASVNIGATRAHHLLTVIDNHMKCVTVAAGLLKNETKKSYIFIKAFGKAPSIVVTDQDGAMRNAIEDEFVGSNHRLCMWHITQKLHAKICAKIYDKTDFNKKLIKTVWNMYIGPEEFEYRWEKIMEEFKLENHKWSESENSFFSYFTNSGLTLMNFMNCFETAMEKQRHVHERMDHKTIDIFPKLKTFLKIECHASNVYTRSLFELVQKEIFVGLWHSQIDSKSLVEGSEVCIIKEIPYVYEMPKKKKKSQSVDKCMDKAEEDDPVDLFFKKDGLYKVLWNIGDGLVVCSCQLFVRASILCKHIFCVFKNGNVEMIPQQYILRRWTKNLIHDALRNKRNRYGEKNVVFENFANEETSIVDYCVHLLSKYEPRLGAFVEKLKSLKKDVEADCLNPPSKNKTDNLEQLVRVSKPPVVEVNNPTLGSTKGQKKLRIKEGKEKAIEKSLKGRNSCSLCSGTDHNKRTCPGEELDFIFETKDGTATIRDYMQTLAPQLKVESNVIDTFSLILNDEQKMNSNGNKIKYFFHITMITKDMFKWKKDNEESDGEKQFEAFSKTIKSEFKKDREMKNMKDLEMLSLLKVPDPHILELWLKVDGEVRLKGSIEDMIFKIPYLISHEPPKGVGPVKVGQKIEAGITCLLDIHFDVGITDARLLTK